MLPASADSRALSQSYLQVNDEGKRDTFSCFFFFACSPLVPLALINCFVINDVAVFLLALIAAVSEPHCLSLKLFFISFLHVLNKRVGRRRGGWVREIFQTEIKKFYKVIWGITGLRLGVGADNKLETPLAGFSLFVRGFLRLSFASTFAGIINGSSKRRERYRLTIIKNSRALG